MICNGDLIIPTKIQRKLVIKSVHDDIHCGVAPTQKRIKLEAWWLGYSWDVKDYIKRCKKYKELRNFTQTTLHSWPREVEPWNHVHMDHAYITGIVLLFILVDSFSVWPEIIHVPDKKSSMIKQILRVIFSRNGIPKILVSNNASKFCDKDLNLWLKKKWGVNRIGHHHITLNQMGWQKEWC